MTSSTAYRADQRLKTYSGGMKRRVNIGAGLLHKPRVLFMDEPTVGIDPQSRRAILDTMKDLNRQGMTVLYTTFTPRTTWKRRRSFRIASASWITAK